jgi:ribonuclease BN (tRNA processing enzyme)
MKIKVLGAHNTESRSTKHVCLLIDNILALDAGGLTSALSFRDQMKLKAILLTHHHYDHIRDIPALAMNLFLRVKSLDIYTHQTVYDSLTKYFLNGDLYPEFHKRPQENPTLKIHVLDLFQKAIIEGYSVQPVPVKHSIPAMGYQIISPDNKSLFYTGDTGPVFSGLIQHISPLVLFIDVTASNRWEESANRTGHLSPNLLKQELIRFREVKGYLPRVFAVHMNPDLEKEIEAETFSVAESLGADIRLAFEGMEIEV